MANRSKKHEQILITAKELFWKYGFRKVSVEEICEKAGASKMTFYRIFENKADLAKALLNDLFEDSMHKHRELMARDIPFTEKISEILVMKSEGSKDLSPEFIEDVYKHDDLGLKSYFEESRQKILVEMLEDYRKVQEKGEIRADFKIEMIPVISQMLTQLASNPEVQSMFKNMQELNLELTKLFFYGISNPDK